MDLDKYYVAPLSVTKPGVMIISFSLLLLVLDKNNTMVNDCLAITALYSISMTMKIVIGLAGNKENDNILQIQFISSKSAVLMFELGVHAFCGLKHIASLSSSSSYVQLIFFLKRPPFFLGMTRHVRDYIIKYYKNKDKRGEKLV